MKSVLFVLLMFISKPLLAAGLGDIHSPNGNDVWSVGEAGTVIHSIDGGETWTLIPLGSTDFHGVSTFADRIWVVGDGGSYFFSHDDGNSWSTQTLGNGVSLNSVSFIDTEEGWIAGADGLILRTTDGGVTWEEGESGTTETLFGVAFTSPTTGYAVGTAGTAIRSDDGGMKWNSVGDPGWTLDLFAVHGIESTVRIAGEDGFSRKSNNGGVTWTVADLRTDTRSDIKDIHSISADIAFSTGGGGYILKRVDGDATLSWGVHPLFATLSAIFFHDGLNGWACADQEDVVIRTTDGGATWSLPQGTSVSLSWSQRLTSTSSIGNTLEVNPWNKDHVYAALGRTVYMSGDRGENWTQTAMLASSGFGSTHSFYISPKDTNIWVAAYTGGGDHIRRSTDRGATWTTTISRNFTSYGMPLERDPDNPDTLLFAADAAGGVGVVYRSVNFGADWDTLSSSNSLRSPCDIVIVPGSPNIVYIGDGITGSGSGTMWRSSDYGKTYSFVYDVSGSEIPMISISRHRNNEAYATAWSSGGVMRTGDTGLSWSQVATTSSSWGTDVAKDDPNVVVYGSYGSGDSFLSTDGGGSFNSVNNNGSNYGYLAYDRATFLAQQSGGVWKLRSTYTMPITDGQALVLLAPNGGEEWGVGEIEEIRWIASNVGSIDIDYSIDSGATWQVVTADLPAGSGLYNWVVPNTPVNEALVRLRDSDDANPVDISDEPFSIIDAVASISPDTLDFGSVAVGQSLMDTVRVTNNGTGTLVVTSVLNGNSAFTPGRTSFTIEPGGSDTLSVWFTPDMGGVYLDTLVMASNGGDLTVFLAGIGGGSMISCDAFTFFRAKCNSAGKAQGMVKLNGDFGGEVVIFDIDGEAIEVTLLSAGGRSIGRMEKAHAGIGAHTVTLVDPAGCFEPVDFNCQVDALPDPEWDALWNEYEALAAGATGPAETLIFGNYPNPFNPTTTIRYQLGVDSPVTVRVYNMLGQEVVALVDEFQKAGVQSVVWHGLNGEGRTVASGLYIYRIQAGNVVMTEKMMFMK